MSQLIQFSLLDASVRRVNQRGGKNFNIRQMVVSDGFGAGGGEEAIHL